MRKKLKNTGFEQLLKDYVFKQHKIKGDNQETGRSMVEMLAVLVIIGILSLIGIWMYEYGKLHYESNHIQETLIKAKNLADVNQNSTQINEIKRLLNAEASKYNPEIQQTEITDAVSGHQKMTYTVYLNEINAQVCRLTFNNQDVLTSLNLTIVNPTSVGNCEDDMQMEFAFDTIRTEIDCSSDSDCTGTNNPFCKKGKCEACEPSDCSGNTPICNKFSGACEPCQEDSECGLNKCAGNGSCGECSADEHCTDVFRPICDTYEGQCKPCATDGECEPKYCAGKGHCGECSGHEHCPTSKPKCDPHEGICEPCPAAKYWHASLQKCTECTANTHCKNALKPICDTSVGECKSCESDSECSPKYCALKGSCGECSDHEHCPASKPKCDKQNGVCKTCPIGTFWNATLKECVQCLTHDNCSSDKPRCAIDKGQCEACPTGTRWHSTKQECVECFLNSHCGTTASPLCNLTTNICEACPTGYGFSYTQNKCVLKRTITLNNVGTITTKIVLDGETMAKPVVSYTDFTFSHWAKSKDGSAVSFPLKITADTTLYAYYGAASQIDVGDYPLNKCGGSRLGSEYTQTSKTFTYSTPQKFMLYLRSAWNNDGYNCSGKEGSFSYKLDGASSGSFQTTCKNIDVGIGKEIVLKPHSDWSKYCDVVWRAHLYRTPQITYPY